MHEDTANGIVCALFFKAGALYETAAAAGYKYPDVRNDFEARAYGLEMEAFRLWSLINKLSR
jgi:hypothetical protein